MKSLLPGPGRDFALLRCTDKCGPFTSEKLAILYILIIIIIIAFVSTPKREKKRTNSTRTVS
jgi:hypothetical protein